MSIGNNKKHKFNDHPPCDEKVMQEGAPYATNAIPIDDANITDRPIHLRTPYTGSFNPNHGEFEHDASKRVELEEKSGPGVGIIVHIQPQ